MSPEEVEALVARDLYVDAYEEQKADPWRYTGTDLAESLESTVFLCPECGQIGHLHSKGNRFFCDCGFEAVYDEYGNLNCKDGTVRKITDLDIAQKEYIDKLAKSDAGTELFSDVISEEIIDENHELVEANEVTVRAFPDCFMIGDRKVSFDDVEAIAINQRNLLMLHLKGIKSHFQLRGPLYYNALKYLYLFRAVKGSVNGLL